MENFGDFVPVEALPQAPPKTLSRDSGKGRALFKPLLWILNKIEI